MVNVKNSLILSDTPQSFFYLFPAREKSQHYTRYFLEKFKTEYE